jgi:hypothetical protein
MPEMVILIKMKCVDQKFGLGYKLKKEDYRWTASMKREKRMVKIREKSLKKKN